MSAASAYHAQVETPEPPSLRIVGAWAITLLVVNAVVACFDTAHAGWDLVLLAEATEGGFRLEPALRAAAQRRVLIRWAALGSFVAAAPLFLVWFHRAYRRVETPRTTAGWALAGWFIPLGNLYLPFRAAKEIASDHAKRQKGNRMTDWVVFGWWTSWLTSALLEQLSGMAVRNGELAPATQLHLGAAALTVVAAISCASFVRAVTRQSE